MTDLKPSGGSSIEDAVRVLRQGLQMYKQAGPDAMQTLIGSFLSTFQTEQSTTTDTAAPTEGPFQIFDHATDSLLREFSTQHGFDLSEATNYRRRVEEGYFRNMYPVIFLYLLWLDGEGEKEILERFQNIFCSAIFGVAGYGILDSNLDEGKGNSAEILLAMAFIQEQERLLMATFECDSDDYQLLDRCKQLYLTAETKEKRLRFIKSPYTKEHPEECGYKAVHTFLPFGLLLNRAGKKHQIEDYLRFFYESSVGIQIIDDLIDLEDDIKNGHYSYPTLGYEDALSKQTPHEVAEAIKSDVAHLQELYRLCKSLIESSKRRSSDLNAYLLGYFVDILERRLDSFFQSEIKGQVVNKAT